MCVCVCLLFCTRSEKSVSLLSLFQISEFKNVLLYSADIPADRIIEFSCGEYGHHIFCNSKFLVIK